MLNESLVKFLGAKSDADPLTGILPKLPKIDETKNDYNKSLKPLKPCSARIS